MEYESRQVKWYWFVVFIGFCGWVAYLLFTANPYLYSHHELRASITLEGESARNSIPSHPPESPAPSAPTFQARFNFQRSGMDPLGAPRSRAYSEYEYHPLSIAAELAEPEHISGDATGYYLSGRSPWVVAVGMDGQTRWRYKFAALDSGRSISAVQLDEANAYFVHPSGRVVCLDKERGQLRWILDLHVALAAEPFLYRTKLVIPHKETDGVHFALVDRKTGSPLPGSPLVPLQPGFLVSYSPSQDLLIATRDNKVVALDPENWQSVWSQSLTDPVTGPAVVVENGIYLSTLGAKVVRLDAGKRVRVDWEADLERPPAAPPSFLPIMNRLSVLDVAGNLITLDAKSGKVIWRTPTGNKNPLNETWSARLKGKNIEEFKMDWLHKGWTIWTPCAEMRFCLYTPGKGQLIQSVPLTGEPVALPVNLDKKLAFLTRKGTNQYGISLALEDGEIKRLKQEAKGALEQTDR